MALNPIFEAASIGTEPERTQPKILVCSASDSKYLFLIRGLLASLEAQLVRPNVDFACFDLGLKREDLLWLESYTDHIVVPGTHFGLDQDANDVVSRSFLVRPFLPEYFPGYDIYVWIDSDVWFQGAIGFEDYLKGAVERGIAVAHERERAYELDARMFAWSVKHAICGVGLISGLGLVTRPQINAGIFAISANAPAWRTWANDYEAAIDRTRKLAPYDQVALNSAVYRHSCSYGSGLAPKVLPPAWNWICRRGVPMWHDERQMFCKPYPPFDPIHAVHLAGIGKHSEYQVNRTGGGSFKTMIVWGSSPDHPVLAISASTS